ncbi:MAG: hypothetical protein FD135_1192 [Comamonadaceae bacterium]|nr:MAG: hypothetical protein FD135_1192 [Comamonadaceae bacterium]
MRGVCRDFAPAGDSLSFASPKESKQRKSDPTVCDPPLRYGQPELRRLDGEPLELASLRQSRFSFPPNRHNSGAARGDPSPRARGATRHIALALQCPAQPGEQCGPHAVVRRRVAQVWADQGTRLSERSEFERHPAQTEQRSEPSRSDGDAFGSLFLCLLSFGEAKESESPAGARPGLPAHQKQPP